jgi:hypothetical protein
MSLAARRAWSSAWRCIAATHFHCNSSLAATSGCMCEPSNAAAVEALHASSRALRAWPASTSARSACEFSMHPTISTHTHRSHPPTFVSWPLVAVLHRPRLEDHPLSVLPSAERGWSSNRRARERRGRGRTATSQITAGMGVDYPLDQVPDYPLGQPLDYPLGPFPALIPGVIHPREARIPRAVSRWRERCGPSWRGR